MMSSFSVRMKEEEEEVSKDRKVKLSSGLKGQSHGAVLLGRYMPRWECAHVKDWWL